MNVVVWWLLLMLAAWVVTAIVLWKTNIVVPNDRERGRSR